MTSVEFSERDAKLICFLVRERHGSPFEHAVFRFLFKAPRFVVAQWQRHRMASYNQQSGRWTKFEPEFYCPDQETRVITDDAYEYYLTRLERGVSKEQARMVLPQNLYTSFWFTVNARSLMNFLMTRNEDHAQWEIRQYAIAVEGMFAEIMPATHRAFEDAGRVAP